MKKLINISIFYAFLGMALGVFYRELTKWTNFYETNSRTQLAYTHVHTLVLGMMFMLILAVLLKSFNKTCKDIKTGLIIYNIGLLASILMMVVRGVLQIVSKTPVSSGIDSMISGLSGISHITLAVGLVMILFKFRNLDNDIEGE